MKNLHVIKATLALFLVFFSLSSLGSKLSSTHPYYPENFYQSVDKGLADKNLSKELFKILSSGHIPTSNGSDKLVSECGNEENCYQQSPLSYGEARVVVLGQLDLLEQQGLFGLRDAYCQDIFTKADFPKGHGPGPGIVPDHNVFNVEHTWPQSRFSKQFPDRIQKADLLILYGVSHKANSSRQNIEFADIHIDQSSVCPAVRRGWVRGNPGTVYFEPPDEHKGNVARAIFYFATRYKMRVSEVEEEALRRWHRLDPVDAIETSRHEEIFKIQKVRNPFIDHPELVDLISDF